MEKITLTCIECPMGCTISVEKDGDKILSVTGNGCPRGKMYAESEVICPRRVLTTTVRVDNGTLIPVKTNKPVKKENLFLYMKKIAEIKAKLPVKIGDVVFKDIEEGVDLVATDNRD